MEFPKTTSHKLSKKPISRSADMRYSHSDAGTRNLISTLKRAPSAPVFPRTYAPNHLLKITSPSSVPCESSNSIATDSHPTTKKAITTSAITGTASIAAARSESDSQDQTTTNGIDPSKNRQDSSKSLRYRNSLRRPIALKSSNSSSDSHTAKLALRQSASFTVGDRMGEKQASYSCENQVKSSNRYSDESKETKLMKKKTGFSGFMSTTFGVGSTKNVKISAPENPVHVTHVGYDNQTGRFTVSNS